MLSEYKSIKPMDTLSLQDFRDRARIIISIGSCFWQIECVKKPGQPGLTGKGRSENRKRLFQVGSVRLESHEQTRREPMDLSNVYFVIGTSYAGKSTIVKNLAKKHGGIALEENYHDAKLPELDSREFPGLTYTRDLQDWHEFIRRTPEEYVSWLKSTQKECEIVELRMIEELLEKPEAQGKKIFVDTNICMETLHRISDDRHVLVMLADPEIGIHRFFDRPDPEKQFLYRLMLEEPDPQAALDNYREILTRVCSRESYDELLHSGFQVIFRDEDRSQEETVLLAERIFGIS